MNHAITNMAATALSKLPDGTVENLLKPEDRSMPDAEMLWRDLNFRLNMEREP